MKFHSSIWTNLNETWSCLRTWDFGESIIPQTKATFWLFFPPPSQSIISHCLQRRTLLQTKVLRWELWHRASPWAGGAERRRLQEPQRAERGTAALCPAFCFSRALFQKSWETYGIALSKSMLKLGPTHRIGKVLGQNEFFVGIAYVWHGIIVTKHAKPFGVLAACVR